MRCFIGTEKQLRARGHIENVIKVISSPLWIPFWLLMLISFYVYDFLEDKLFNWLETWLDSISFYLTKWFVK